MIKVTIESDLEGVNPVVLVPDRAMYGHNADLYQDMFMTTVQQGVFEVYSTEMNRKRNAKTG